MMAEDRGASTSSIKLTVKENDRERTFEFTEGKEISIGRSADCDIHLDTRRASRQHARLVYEDDRYHLVDLESSNGTLLNSVRVSRQVLFPGDILQIGEARIIYGGRPPDEDVAPMSSEPAEETIKTPAADHDDTSGETPADADKPFPSRPPSSRSRFPRSISYGALISVMWAVLILCLFLWWASTGFMLPFPELFEDKVASDTERGNPSDNVNASEESSLVPVTETGENISLPPREGPGITSPEGTIPGEGRPAPLEETSPPAQVDVVDAPDTLDEILQKISSGEYGWEAISRLDGFLKSMPNIEERIFVERMLPVLEGLQDGVNRRWVELAEQRFVEMERTRSTARAIAIAKFLAVASEGEPLREYWNQKVATLEQAATSEFEEVERRLSDLTAAGKPDEALQAIIEVNTRYAGASFFDGLLERYARAALAGAQLVEEPLSNPAALRLKDSIALSMESCRFDTMPGVYYALLAMDPPPEERVEFLNGLVRSGFMDRMFREFLARAAEKTPRLSIYEGYEGRILAVDKDRVEFELDIDGRTGIYKDSLPWDRITFLKKFELFKSVPLSPEALLGVVLFAFHYGHEEGAHAALIRLKNRQEQSSLADAVLALYLGEPVPEGGYVEYRGRLVTPVFKAAEIARRKKIREEEKAAREELARLKKESTLEAFIKLAKKYRERGLFNLAQTVLRAIAGRFPETAAGVEARALLQDPVLLVRTLKISGPSSNRLDFYFMGEGYPIEDDYQEAFQIRARAAFKLLLREEPFMEYESYLNFHGVHLGSRDRGVDRNPGNVSRDTALDGKVEWDRFTVNNSKVHAILRRVGEGGVDRQALVIGNDYAGVATGGGGVSSVPKVGLSVLGHEIGHSLTGLRDEYDFEPGTNPNRNFDNKRAPNVPTRPLRPNVMVGSDRDDVLAKVLWKPWIDAGEKRWWNGSLVSVFEGAHRRRFNHWRPQSSCKMRTAGAKFCVVCMEAMVKRLYKFVRPIDRVDPDQKQIILDAGESVQVRVWPMKPKTHFMETTWRLSSLPGGVAEGPTLVDGKEARVPLNKIFRRFDPEGRPVEIAVIRAKEFGPGDYILEVTVRDPTPWVLRDDDPLLTDTRRWTITIREKKKAKPIYTPSGKRD